MLKPARLIASSKSICNRRRFLQPKQQKATAKAEPGINGNELRRSAAELAEVVTVSVVDIVPDGVRNVGEKPQDAPEGKPEQLNWTIELNPFCGVIVTVVAPLCPPCTEMDAGLRAIEKSGGMV